MSDLVGNPEDRFSRVAAHVKAVYSNFLSQLQARFIYEISIIHHPTYYRTYRNSLDLYKPGREQTGLWSFQPGLTQTGLYCHRSRLEA